MFFHLFIKIPGQGFCTRAMSKNRDDMVAWGNELIRLGKISNYQVMQSDSTSWTEAWVNGRVVDEGSFLKSMKQGGAHGAY